MIVLVGLVGAGGAALCQFYDTSGQTHGSNLTTYDRMFQTEFNNSEASV